MPRFLGSAMLSAVPSTASVQNALRRFRRSRRGSAAVEFALVAPVFFALLFAIIETAIMFFASQVLETGAQNAARMIMTGQAQSGSYTPTMLITQVICPTGSLASMMFNCVNGTNGISINVQNYPSFSNATINSQIDASGNFINNMHYNPGGPGDIVVVQLFYQWPLYVTGLGYNISNLSGSKRLLAATAAFRNEPY
jgi:Flp pilus assembly protein TadG